VVSGIQLTTNNQQPTTDIKTNLKYPFENLRISGFRRLSNVSLQLKPLNVLIGANGSGKTTLLDGMSLLAASASGNLVESVSNLGGYSSLRTNLSDWSC
jgi:ABC-type uncharacterized transport system ATPase subunit